MQLTRIPSPAHSTANERLRFSTPARAAPLIWCAFFKIDWWNLRSWQSQQWRMGEGVWQNWRLRSRVLLSVSNYTSEVRNPQRQRLGIPNVEKRRLQNPCINASRFANLHCGSQSLCRNPWSGNFKGGKGVAIVGGCGGRVDGRARCNATHPHLKIGVKQLQWKGNS